MRLYHVNPFTGTPSFIAGRIHTAFLERAGVLEESSDVARAKIAAIAAAAVAYRENQAAIAKMYATPAHILEKAQQAMLPK